jgi:hypothetical protein
MKVEMTIPERLYTMGLLPKEGNILTLRVTRELMGKIGFSAIELTDFEIEEKDGQIAWNDKGNIPATIEFLDSELGIIRKELTRLDNENKLSIELLSVYEKFM